ncbi:hypothetical protein K402DRAFT_344623 [Aulographum hederae CBS 113979]|uniref:Exocyst complex protein EXO70 n=1 Tax=Aulographum hederae CBS 113979 TaxID=1176131 RepID=A0A6G1HGL7_9PEZI|nr:hypothetical protein K402DRAFT_344623 [Aulographum hederae CBS 113979]
MIAPRTRKAAFAEEKAEVEVLGANLEKLKGLTKKIQGSMNRLESSGKSVQEHVAPIYGNTQKLQIANSNVDRILEAIGKIREPLDKGNREEQILRSNPKQVGVTDYIASIDRTTRALAELKKSNLRSNQQAIAELNGLMKTGMTQLQDVFRDILREDARPVEPLHYLTKQLQFPRIPEEKSSRLRTINNHVFASMAQTTDADVRDYPTTKTYAEIRGTYLTASLQNLSSASISTARKMSSDAMYRQGTSGIGTYAAALESMYAAEYENICPIFAREDWTRVCNMTCRSSLNEFSKTLRELNNHIRANLITDCYLAFEIIELVSSLALRLENRGVELKVPMAEALQPTRQTAKESLGALVEDTRAKMQSMMALPSDAGAVSVTAETMVKLQTLTSYLSPLSSILTSLGDGGWSTQSPATSRSHVPTLKSLDVGPDSGKLFANYARDLLEDLYNTLNTKSRAMIKNKSAQGVFMANNIAVIDRMTHSSELQNLLFELTETIDSWRKKAYANYMDAWKDVSTHLLDVQYTSRSVRPQSGGGIDSAAIVKSLSSKDKEAIKEKFKNFNLTFDELITKYKSFKMEREVRQHLAREIARQIEPLYGRFFDRYHEIDKGRGKHVKFDKSQMGTVLAGLS